MHRKVWAFLIRTVRICKVSFAWSLLLVKVNPLIKMKIIVFPNDKRKKWPHYKENHPINQSLTFLITAPVTG